MQPLTMAPEHMAAW